MDDDQERRARNREESRLRREQRSADSRLRREQRSRELTGERRERAAESAKRDAAATDDAKPLGGFEKTVIAVGVGVVAIVLKSAQILNKQRAEANRFHWTDKNRWE